MKNHTLLFISIVIFFSSCIDKELVASNAVITTPTFSATPESLKYAATGGNDTLTVTTEVPVIANQIYLQRPVLLVYIIILTCNGR